MTCSCESSCQVADSVVELHYFLLVSWHVYDVRKQDGILEVRDVPIPVINRVSVNDSACLQVEIGHVLDLGAN